jgi:hypothetical protein
MTRRTLPSVSPTPFAAEARPAQTASQHCLRQCGFKPTHSRGVTP